MRKVAILLLIINLALMTLLAQTTGEHSESRRARFPESRTTWEGEVWIRWEFPIRQWFVQAALAGYDAGYDEACRNLMLADKSAADHPKSKDDDCVNGRRHLRGEAAKYSKAMTDFYTRYPEDRDLPIAYLVEMLLDPKPKTLEEIHAWVSNISR